MKFAQLDLFSVDSNIRRLDIVWTEEEADKFDEVKRDVEANGQSIQDYVKLLLLRHRHDD